MSNLLDYSLQQLSVAIHEQKITPLELVEAYLQQIRQEEQTIAAWCHIDEEKALQMAKQYSSEAKEGKFRGPLHGIPVGIKDNIDVKGMPTKLGSKVWEHRQPSTRDAKIIAHLREQGAIILGKTHMTEFAWFDPAPTKNPHHLAHTPGGSSSGSAAAVAAKMVPFSLGSQTAASVSRPAAYCGIAGFKPTSAPILTDAAPFAPSFDTIGFFTKNVNELAFLMKPLLEKDVEKPHDPSNPKSTTIGILVDPLHQEADAALQSLLNQVEHTLHANDYTVERVSSPYSFQQLISWHRIALTYEAASEYKQVVLENEDLIGTKFVELVKEGTGVSKAEYEQALTSINRAKEQFWAESKVDFFLTLPISTPAPSRETTGDPRFTTPWTVLGGPLSVIPNGKNEEGLPLAIMLASPPHTDKQLLSYTEMVNALMENL